LSLTLTLRKINYKFILNYFIVAYAFCLPISKAGISLFGGLLILFWLLDANYKEKYYAIKNNTLILSLIAFISFSVLSVFWSSDTFFALSYLKKYWHLFLIIVIYTSLDKKYIKYIFSSFLAGMFISEIISYGIFFEFWTKEGVSPNDPSPFLDHTSYSALLAFTIFILMYKIMLITNIKWRIFYLIYFFTAVSNLFINGGRTGQVIFFIGIIIIGFFNIKCKFRAIFVSLLGALLFFIAAYNISPVFKSRMDTALLDMKKMVYENNYRGSLPARIALWKIGSENFLSSPLMGTGIGDEAQNSKEDIKRYQLESFMSTNGVFHYVDYHNAFVQYLVQLGIVGFLLFLSIFYFFIKIKIQSWVYFNLKLLFIGVYILWSMIGLTFHLNTSLVFFVLFSSVFMKIAYFEKIEKNIN